MPPASTPSTPPPTTTPAVEAESTIRAIASVAIDTAQLVSAKNRHEERKLRLEEFKSFASEPVIKDVQIQLSAALAEVDSLAAQAKSSLQQASDGLNQTVNQILHASNRSVNNTVNRLSDRLAQAATDREEIRKECSVLRQKLESSLAAVRSDDEATRVRFAKQITALESQVNRLEQDLIDKNRKLRDSAYGQISELRSSLETLKTQKPSAEVSKRDEPTKQLISQIEMQLKTLNSAVKDIEVDLKRIKTDVQENAGTTSNVSKAISSTLPMIKTLMNTHAELSSSATVESKKICDLETKMEDMQRNKVLNPNFPSKLNITVRSQNEAIAKASRGLRDLRAQLGLDSSPSDTARPNSLPPSEERWVAVTQEYENQLRRRDEQINRLIEHNTAMSLFIHEHVNSEAPLFQNTLASQRATPTPSERGTPAPQSTPLQLDIDNITRIFGPPPPNSLPTTVPAKRDRSED